MPSTVIANMKYDPETERLTIVFISGLIYDYKNVPVTVYEELKNSRSKGIFLNKHIKGQYDYEKRTESE